MTLLGPTGGPRGGGLALWELCDTKNVRSRRSEGVFRPTGDTTLPGVVIFHAGITPVLVYGGAGTPRERFQNLEQICLGALSSQITLFIYNTGFVL